MLKVFEFVGKIELMDSNLWGHYIKIPTEISAYFKKHTDDMRVVCNFNGVFDKQCAIMSSGQGYHFVMMTKDSRKRLNLQLGDSLTVSIKKDDSKYGLPMPVELEEVFNQDVLAYRFFEALTKGKQRSLLHIAGNVKNPQKRIERSLAIAHHLVKMKGLIDYKILQQDLKDFRY